MDCMISGIFFHHLAMETQGDFDAAIAKLDHYIEDKEETVDITVLGVGLIVNLLSSAARPVVVRMASDMPTRYRQYQWLAEWTAGAIQTGIDSAGMEEEVDLISIEVDTFVFSHDRDDCVKMAASIIYHYYWMVLGNYQTVLNYGRWHQRRKL